MTRQSASKEPAHSPLPMTGLLISESPISKLPVSKPMRIKAAAKRLESVRLYLLQHGPLRQAVAVTLDLCLIYCRHEDRYGENYRTVKSMLSACRRQLPEEATGEEAMLRAGLDSLAGVLESNPEEQIFDALVDLRSSFVVPVRGIIAERFSRSSIVLVRDVMGSE